MESVDIKLTLQPGDYYDITLDDQGDIAKVTGLESALLMSLFSEVRADKSEVGDPARQRGWWGNLLNPIQNYQIGSKLWLLEQSRVNYDTQNRALDYAEDGFKWLVEDGIADSITVDTSMNANNSKIYLTIVIYRPQDIVLNYSYSLWQGTQLNYGN